MIGYLYFFIGLVPALAFVVGFFYDYYKVRRPTSKSNWIPDFFTWVFSFWALSLIIAWPVLIVSYIIDWYEKHSKE